MKKISKLTMSAIVWMIILLALSQIVLAGSTVDYGTLTSTPADGTVTYIAYLSKTSGNEILTEDGYNAGLGTDLGYQTGYWWLAVSNFDAEIDGDAVQIYFTGIGDQVGNSGNLTFNWDGTAGYTGHGEVAFGTSTNPATPTNLVATPTNTQGIARLEWMDNTDGSATYRLYRSTQASGADNGASNGHYYRIDPFDYDCSAGSCVGHDTTAYLGMNWYIVVAEAPLSGHSNEASVDGSEVTAVELDYFTATPGLDEILLEWETVSELEIAGFNIKRAEGLDGEQTLLNDELIESKEPGSPVGASYQYSDETAMPGITYYYWLECLDMQGHSIPFGPESAALTGFDYHIYLPLVVRD